MALPLPVYRNTINEQEMVITDAAHEQLARSMAKLTMMTLRRSESMSPVAVVPA